MATSYQLHASHPQSCNLRGVQNSSHESSPPICSIVCRKRDALCRQGGSRFSPETAHVQVFAQERVCWILQSLLSQEAMLQEVTRSCKCASRSLAYAMAHGNPEEILCCSTVLRVLLRINCVEGVQCPNQGLPTWIARACSALKSHQLPVWSWCAHMCSHGRQVITGP